MAEHVAHYSGCPSSDGGECTCDAWEAEEAARETLVGHRYGPDCEGDYWQRDGLGRWVTGALDQNVWVTATDFEIGDNLAPLLATRIAELEAERDFYRRKLRTYVEDLTPHADAVMNAIDKQAAALSESTKEEVSSHDR